MSMYIPASSLIKEGMIDITHTAWLKQKSQVAHA